MNHTKPSVIAYRDRMFCFVDANNEPEEIWCCSFTKSGTIRVRIVEIARFSQNQDKMQKNENLTVFEAVAADAVSYADAVLEDLDKKK